MKVMFLDESGDHGLVESKIDKSYPMFVLAGCIFDLDDYTRNVEREIDQLKVKYFGSTKTILRSYDIRKQKKDFSKLVDRRIRDAFNTDLSASLTRINFVVIAAAINKIDLINRYSKPANPYDLCFWFILERAIMYLGKSQDQMIFRAESREGHNDRELARIYEYFRENGNNNLIKSSEVKSKFIDLSFNQKTQNIVGHQIADLVAYPIGRWALDKTRNNPAFTVVEPKIHTKNGVYINCGLKIFP